MRVADDSVFVLRCVFVLAVSCSCSFPVVVSFFATKTEAKWQTMIRYLVDHGAKRSLETCNKFGQKPEDFELVKPSQPARPMYGDEKNSPGNTSTGTVR